jgi:hypothetical protein
MKKKILTLLVLLMTAVSGAWAADTYTITFSGFGNEACNKTVTDATLEYSETFNVTDVYANYSNLGGVGGSNDYVSISKSQDEKQITITVKSPFEGTVNVTVYYQNENWDESERNISVTCVKSAPAITVEWNASTKTGTFAMPGSDVVLTPIYSKATIYEADGVTEKGAYASLQEAFAAVQDGDVITLDWDVTLTEQLTAPERNGNPIHFTLDFNGYTITDGSGMGWYNIIELSNGDMMFLTDESEGKNGGLKGMVAGLQGSSIVFKGGRYDFGQGLAATNIKDMWDNYFALNFGWQMALNKEFINLNNGSADDDGFFVRVAYKDFELTIGAQKFATFYLDENIKLADETPAGVGLYTISNINDDRSEATITALTGVVEADLPMLIYNGTDAEQTVTIKVTADEADAENQGITSIEYFQGTATDRKFTADDMAAADFYALSDGSIFLPVLDPGTLGANQCWLQFNHAAGAPARGITLVFGDETTSIQNLTPALSEGEGVFYDLQGRKVTVPAKGVYIMNGRKVVVK